MRNIWYPQSRAEYMTQSQLRNAKHLSKERDYTFGLRGGDPQASRAQQARPADVRLELLSVRSLATHSASLEHILTGLIA